MENENSEHLFISFLKSLFKKPFIHLRFLPQDISDYLSLSEIESIPKILNDYREQYHCYFAVAARVDGDGSKKGTIEIPGLREG